MIYLTNQPFIYVQDVHRVKTSTKSFSRIYILPMINNLVFNKLITWNITYALLVISKGGALFWIKKILNI